MKKLSKDVKEQKELGLWKTVYTDMTTNLTLFFILLYATAILAIQQGLGKGELQEMARKVFEVKVGKEFMPKLNIDVESQKAVLGLTKIKDISGVEKTEKELRIRLPNAILFDRGTAVLKPSAKNTLIQVFEKIKDLPYNKIVVEGHTCDLPIPETKWNTPYYWELTIARQQGIGGFKSNWELGATRASQVVEFLIKEKIVQKEKVSAAALGPYHPIAPNDSEENRQKNRRIEIKVIF